MSKAREKTRRPSSKRREKKLKTRQSVANLGGGSRMTHKTHGKERGRIRQSEPQGQKMPW